MENYKTTNIYKILCDLHDYIRGDLEVFHKICKEVESKEIQLSSSNSEVSSSDSPDISSFRTTTTQTTRSPTDNGKLYRLTIPVTLSLFAVIDFVGFLSGENSNPNNTEKNFKEFFKQSPTSISDKNVELINFVFRQGLSHIYFPKLNLGISYHSKNPLEKLIFNDDRDVLTLNVNMLEKVVLQTFELIKEKHQLYEIMEQKYQDLINKYDNSDGEKISNYHSKG